jgi:hypothetical protein
MQNGRRPGRPKLRAVHPTGQEATDVFTAHPIRRPTIVTALALTLLGITMTGPAAARPVDIHDDLRTSSLAGTTSTPRQDLRSPDALDAARQNEIELAIERYYQSYGEPEPLPVAEAPAPVPSDDTPWLPIGLAAAAALAIVAASATHLRRLSIRRRRTAGAVS